MSRRGSRRAGTRAALAAVALVAALVIPTGGAQAAPLVGIGDQAPETMGDPLFTPLGISTVRIVLPWDIASADPVRLRDWVQEASDRGIEPLIAFGHSRGDHCPSAPCTLPSVEAYRAAFDAVHQAYPDIRLFTPWNEPNHASQPTAGNPEAAAHFADVVAAECPDCTVVGADVLDSPGMLDYLFRYEAALNTQPAVWGLHNYYDTTYFQPAGTQSFIASVPGPVWLTESGGIVTWRTADGRVQMPYDEKRAAASLSYALGLAAANSDRVQRIYVYQWRAGAADDFDAGLVRADGSPRPALDVLRSALGVVAPVGPSGPGRAPPTTATPAGKAELVAPPTTPQSRVSLRRARLDGAGRLLVAIACAGGPCRGRVVAEGSGRIAERLVNGRVAPGTLSPRARVFDLAAGATAELRMRLPAAVVRKSCRRATQVKLTVVPSGITQFLPLRKVVRISCDPKKGQKQYQ